MIFFINLVLDHVSVCSSPQPFASSPHVYPSCSNIFSTSNKIPHFPDIHLVEFKIFYISILSTWAT